MVRPQFAAMHNCSGASVQALAEVLLEALVLHRLPAPAGTFDRQRSTSTPSLVENMWDDAAMLLTAHIELGALLGNSGGSPKEASWQQGHEEASNLADTKESVL